MRRLLIFAGLGICVLSCLPSLYNRWTSERRNRQVALVVDWREVRDLANREIPSPQPLLQVLRDAGVQGVLFSPLTLKEAVRGNEPALAQRLISFENAAIGRQALDELTRRGVRGLKAGRAGDSFTLTRTASDFSGLEDVEIGYDKTLLDVSRDQHLALFLRVNQDPWLAERDPLPENIAGLIFTTDDPPGGIIAVSDWAAYLRAQNMRNMVVEFKPTHASMAVARAFPGATLRTHTIPTAELRDLNQAQELSRWQRAVRERSCRCLLFRPAPSESWESFKMRLDALHHLLMQEGWTLELPSVQPALQATPHIKLLIQLGLGFLIAALAPLVGLAMARTRSGWRAFFTVVFISLIGGVLIAAVAYGPETRFEIVPFRGIKAAIIISWLGSLLMLYPFQELRSVLLRPLTRIDLLFGFLLIVIMGYGIARSGNASPSLRVGSEQGLRDYLEKTLEVRPRFKEFAIGYPLLLVGFLMRRRRRMSFDARPLIGLGMIGPISTVNTFCHFHSPLILAFARSGLGVLLGSILGLTLYMIYSFFEGERV